MFSETTQAKYWMFESSEEISNFRAEANRRCIEKLAARRKVSDDRIAETFLTLEEENFLLKHYEYSLGDFCRNFDPPMPPEVIGSSFHYFKRFYLINSPMDFHPKEILVTCVYLACKVEEFNVSMKDFVRNIRGDKDKAVDIILSLELLLMQQLSYQLQIHNPFRAVEGLLIDLKNRWGKLASVDGLRPAIEDFIAATYKTDAPLIFSPSQIALAAVVNSARMRKENLDIYVTDVLLSNAKDKLPALIESVRKIRQFVKSLPPVNRERMKALEKKLDKCRNEENDPDSPDYLNPMGEEDDDDFMGGKQPRFSDSP